MCSLCFARWVKAALLCRICLGEQCLWQLFCESNAHLVSNPAGEHAPQDSDASCQNGVCGGHAWGIA